MENKKIRKVAFLGGASWDDNSETFKSAFDTAKILAEHGYEIVNGGGPGVMRASTMGAKTAGGKVLAITYHPNKKKKNYGGVDPENHFDQEIITLDYFDRTKVMLQNSDIHIVFKGGTGTISEWGMTWANSRIHEEDNKPIVLFGSFWGEILYVIKKNMFLRPGELELLHICETPQEVLEYIEKINFKVSGIL